MKCKHRPQKAWCRATLEAAWSGQGSMKTSPGRRQRRGTPPRPPRSPGVKRIVDRQINKNRLVCFKDLKNTQNQHLKKVLVCTFSIFLMSARQNCLNSLQALLVLSKFSRTKEVWNSLQISMTNYVTIVIGLVRGRA